MKLNLELAPASSSRMDGRSKLLTKKLEWQLGMTPSGLPSGVPLGTPLAILRDVLDQQRLRFRSKLLWTSRAVTQTAPCRVAEARSLDSWP